MRDTYWIIENKLAGSTGPNLFSWDYRDIRDESFGTILSVNNGELVEGRRLAEMNINHAVIPMTHRAPPERGDLEQCVANLPLAVQYIEQNISQAPVLIHCRSGKDRTALVAAAYMMKAYNLTAQEAVNRFLKIRPIAFSAEGWGIFAVQVLEMYALQSKLMHPHT